MPTNATHRPMTISASPPKSTSIARHYFRYLSANLLSVVAGFISFPIMTRLLSSSEYGILGFFEPYALVWVAVLKLGTQQSTVRLYHSHCLNQDVEQRKRFYTSLVMAPALISTVMFAASLLIVSGIQAIWNINHIYFLYVVLLLGQLDVLSSLITNVMMAREMSRTSMWFSVASRYLTLTLVIATIYFLMRSALGVYLARVVSSVIMLSLLMRWALTHCDFDRSKFSPEMLKESFSFGLPLVFSEISLILLAFADRILIKHLTGSFAEVGTYTIGYSLAMYVGIFMRSSMLPAFQPVANRTYETEGAAAFLKLQRRMLRIMLYVSVSICIGLYFVGRDLLILLAGQDKAEAGPVFQWIGANYVCTPLFAIAAYGLTLVKRTRLISTIVIISTLINVGLNYMWIPRYGIMGAVYATLVSYLMMWGSQVLCSPRELWPRLRPGEWLRPVGCGAAFALVAWATGLFGVQGPIARLAVLGVVFAVTFVAPALALDHELRIYFAEKLGRALPRGLRARLTGRG